MSVDAVRKEVDRRSTNPRADAAYQCAVLPRLTLRSNFNRGDSFLGPDPEDTLIVSHELLRSYAGTYLDPHIVCM